MGVVDDEAGGAEGVGVEAEDAGGAETAEAAAVADVVKEAPLLGATVAARHGGGGGGGVVGVLLHHHYNLDKLNI